DMLELARGQALPGVGAKLELPDRLRRTEATALGRLEPDRLRLQAGQGAVANAQEDAEDQRRIHDRLAQRWPGIGVERIEPGLPGRRTGACHGHRLARLEGRGARAEHFQGDRGDVLALAFKRAGALRIELRLAA